MNKEKKEPKLKRTRSFPDENDIDFIQEIYPTLERNLIVQLLELKVGLPVEDVLEYLEGIDCVISILFYSNLINARYWTGEFALSL
jgi:hypothetical protein